MKVLGGMLIALPFIVFFGYVVRDGGGWHELMLLGVAFAIAMVATACVVGGAFLLVGGR